MGFEPCCLGINKVEGWLDLVEHEFWVWPCLGRGTASLKLRQFKSAVCDAFGVIFVLGGPVRGVVCLWGVEALELLALNLLGCLINGWGFVIWPNVGLLVVNYLLHTCILFSCTCTAMTTGRLTWGVVF